ncbi:MAG: sodium:proton antiporter, partial [Paramuribaculum sp.]|nr:sodium:proton antiporter [Paramuribaculum sp.]
IVFGTFGMLVSGQTLKVAIESGFSLTQIGEFAFIIATLGMQLGVLDPTIYPIVVAVSVLTTFTTPYFIRLADPFYGLIERILPRRLHFLIDRYSTKASEVSEIGRVWRTLLKRYIWRFLLYASVLTAICLISLKFLIPWLTEHLPVWGRFLGTLATLAAMAPFLLALSVPSSKKSEREMLRRANAHYDMPLVVMRVFRLLMALGFVCYIISAIYSPWFGVLAGIFVFFLISISLSKQLSRRMRRIEEKFINNLNERDLRRSGAKNNIISNLHLAFMTVGYGCEFVGMRLAESPLRSKYGVSIASIQRGSTGIPVPTADVRIFPGDVLAVIGTEDEIQRLLPVVEAEAPDSTAEAICKPSDLKLTSLQLSD